ncbi:Phosphomannomutase [uncultured virus]|nr:Phosphomannomutase [uncultured virus]
MSTLLFDVDGTLTVPMKSINDDMITVLRKLKSKGHYLSVVGGSDYEKIAAQLSGALDLFDYVCTENGLVTYHNNEVTKESLLSVLGEKRFQTVINAILYELSQIVIPIKRDKFIEVRSACINVSPIGRSCSYQERCDFNEYDKIHKVREFLITRLTPVLEKCNLTAVIGGMISIDIYPIGWDKRYCLKYFPDPPIHFFGDKTEPGGNDYAIYTDDRVIGHSVRDPCDLKRQLVIILSEHSV